MATVIDSISFCNFYNYYGDFDRNVYEFNPGLNVVVADNGAGKSKLFSGFSWILMDKVFDSDRKTSMDVKDSMVKMISDKAKDETGVGEEVKCGVQIVFSDGQFEYKVQKGIWGRRLNKGSATDENNWTCNFDEVEVSKKDKLLLDFKLIYDQEEKKKIIEKLIAPKFRKYALLQGEEVDHILDFNNKQSLKTAIDTLSSISRIEKLIEIAEYLADKGEKDLTKMQKQHAKDQSSFDSLIEERDLLQTRLERKKADLRKYQEELTKAKEEKDRLIGLISNAQARQEIRDQETGVESTLKRINNEHSEYINNLNDNFFDVQAAWLLYNTHEQGNKFVKLREDYLERRKELAIIEEVKSGNTSFFTKLPAGSPDSFSLQKMLDKEECFVCGRKASTNSEAWKHIQSVLHSHTRQPQKKSSRKNDFKELLDKFQLHSQSFHNQIKNIEDNIKTARHKDKKYRDEKNLLQKRKDELKDELLGLLGANETDDKTIINQYGGAERRIQQHEEQIKGAESDIEHCSAALKVKNQEIEDLSDNNINDGYVRREGIMSDILIMANNTKERFFDDIIAKLERKANEYFKELTKDNAVDGGIIRIIRHPGDTFSLEIRDKEDNKIYGLSEGFQRMKKLAVIMAIISSSERGRMDYPLIADAPLSAFGKAFVRGFFDKVPEVFQQSIVMVKDLYDKDSENHLNDVGNTVLNKIKANGGSLHINEINESKSQLERQTSIRRY